MTNFYFSNFFKKENKQLIVYGLLIELFYLFLFLVEPVRKYFGEDDLTLKNNLLFLFLVFILLVNLTIYLLSYRLAEKNIFSKKTITFFFFLYSIALIFLWPIGSRDVFSYVAFSRVFIVYHQNPYLTVYNSLSQDLFYDLFKTHWLSFVSPYGPVFTYISIFLSSIFKNNLILTLASFKLFFVSLNILVYFIISKLSDDTKYLLLYGWNPLILFEIVVNCHNDILTIIFLALGFFLMIKKPKQVYRAWVCFLLAVFIKYTSIFLLPLIFVYIISLQKNQKRRLEVGIFLLLISIFLAVVLFFPFWISFSEFIKTYINFSKNSPPIFSPPFSLLLAAIFNFFKINNPLFWGKAVGKIIYFVSLTIIYLRILVLAARNLVSLKIILSYSGLIIFILLLTLIQFSPWYLTVLFFLLIISDIYNHQSKTANYIFYMTFYGIIEYLLLR